MVWLDQGYGSSELWITSKFHARIAGVYRFKVFHVFTVGDFRSSKYIYIYIYLIKEKKYAMLFFLSFSFYFFKPDGEAAGYG